ncbi:ABC transporter substrate-binding protein [Oceanibium sediminis]|uniref:ABC transporter substrate-binding protein n=1 Tax=Oceanibium sediminis TaxID=2026339 RepID=UPI000DD3EB4F|nr:ABC transporter substrate-binding protein [Oceanibium sediminis]
MQTKAKWLATVAATALIATGAAAQDGDTIKIGGMVSITGAGASIGRVAEIGWQMAIDDINAAGGIAGKQVEFVLADTMTDPTHAVSEARRLVENEQIDAMVGPVTSQETIPVTAVTTAANIPQITTAASATLTPEAAPYHFSNSPTGLNQMIANIEYAINELNLTKLAIISDNGGMSKAAVQEIEDYMAEKGIEPTAIQEFAFRTEDMTPQLFSLRSSGAEGVLIINSLGDDARKFLQNRDEIGWNVPVLGSLTTTNFAVGNAEILGVEAFNNVYSVQFEGMSYCPGDPVGESLYAKFDAKAKETVSDLSRLGGSSALSPYYVEPFVLKAAIEGSGSTDGDKVAAWIEANAAEIENMLGTFAANDQTHFLPSSEAMVVTNKAYAPREDGLTERLQCD